jgi:hypothetical protein
MSIAQTWVPCILNPLANRDTYRLPDQTYLNWAPDKLCSAPITDIEVGCVFY